LVSETGQSAFLRMISKITFYLSWCMCLHWNKYRWSSLFGWHWNSFVICVFL